MVCVGDEKFICNGNELDITVLDFWRFTYSDLNSDPRDYLAEFLVSKALGIDTPYNKEAWTLFDILYGSTRVEVKCTGYFQTWRTDNKVSQNRYYSIKPAHDKVKNTFERQNDIYVFCLLLGNTREEANPLNLNNWEFYIVPTSVINKECQEANTIRLGRIKKMGYKALGFYDIKNEIDKIIQETN